MKLKSCLNLMPSLFFFPFYLISSKLYESTWSNFHRLKKEDIEESKKTGSKDCRQTVSITACPRAYGKNRARPRQPWDTRLILQPLIFSRNFLYRECHQIQRNGGSFFFFSLDRRRETFWMSLVLSFFFFFHRSGNDFLHLPELWMMEKNKTKLLLHSTSSNLRQTISDLHRVCFGGGVINF